MLSIIPTLFVIKLCQLLHVHFHHAIDLLLTLVVYFLVSLIVDTNFLYYNVMLYPFDTKVLVIEIREQEFSVLLRFNIN